MSISGFEDEHFRLRASDLRFKGWGYSLRFRAQGSGLEV